MSFGGVVISIVVSHVFMLNHATFYSSVEMRPNPECNSITTLWHSNVSMKNSPSFWMYCIWFPLSFVFRESVRPYANFPEDRIFSTRNIQAPLGIGQGTYHSISFCQTKVGLPTEMLSNQQDGRAKTGDFWFQKKLQEKGGLNCWKIECCRHTVYCSFGLLVFGQHSNLTKWHRSSSKHNV